MRRHVTSLGLCCLMLVATSGAAVAGCADSIELLAKQVELIGDAAPLATDPTALPGPGDTLVTLEKPALTSRTSEAFDVFEPPADASREKTDWGFPANLARAQESLDSARQALNLGDTTACEQAVTVGLDAAHRARAWLRASAASG